MFDCKLLIICGRTPHYWIRRWGRVVASQSGTVERELILQFRAVERSSRIVEISIDCRQTVTVRSFVKELNSFTESSSTLVNCNLQYKLVGQYELWNGVLRPKYIYSGVRTITDLWTSQEHSIQWTLQSYCTTLSRVQIIINRESNFIRFSYDKSSCYNNNIKVPGLVSLFVKRLFMWCV